MANVCVYKVSQRTQVAMVKHNESLGFRTSAVGIPVILKMSPVLKFKLKKITLIIEPIINFKCTFRVFKTVTSGKLGMTSPSCMTISNFQRQD
jgi:hypothetical protein